VRSRNLIAKRGQLTVKLKNGQKHLFRLQTTTYPPVMLDDGSPKLISLGSLAPETDMVVRRTLTVHAPSGVPLPRMMWRPASEAGNVTCRLSERKVETFGSGLLQRRIYDLDVTIASGHATGLQREAISFGSDGPPTEGDAFEAIVNWSVASQFSIHPPRWVVRSADLDSDDLGSNRILQMRCSVSGVADALYRIVKVESSDAALQVVETSEGAAQQERNLLLSLDVDRVVDRRPFLAYVLIDLETDSGDSSFVSHERIPVLAIE